MSELQTYATDITRDRARLRIDTGGSNADALVSSSRPDVALWRQAIDQMLGWRSAAADLAAEDKPDDDVLDTAIDYAVDQIENISGAAAPSSIIPSGSGRIAMEWNDGSITFIIEFVALGTANLIEFRAGKVIRRSTLRRNPKSRQLELWG